MDWYYLQMRDTHMILAWVSVAMFFARGLAFQLQYEWAADTRLQVIVFGVDTLLTFTGLSLWVLIHFNPLRDGWFMAKLIALVGYTVFAHIAMWRGQFTALAYGASLLCLAYMMAASYMRSALLGLA